jgi:hypothetical protein
LHQHQAAIRARHDRLAKRVERARTRMLKTFPDLGEFDAVMLLSLLTFDAKTGVVGRRRVIFLGVDTLTQVSNTGLDVLLTHELVHIYHRQVSPRTFGEYLVPLQPVPLYRRLWTEGLATWLSRHLHPRARLQDVLMSPTLAHHGPRHLRGLAHQVGGALEDASADTARRYFSATDPGDIPVRSGYYLGMQVVGRIAQTVPPEELPRLQGRRLHQAIRAALEDLSATVGASDA